MLLLLPPFQDRLLGHLWVGAAQIEHPVHISMNGNNKVSVVQWKTLIYMWQILCFEFSCCVQHLTAAL